MRDVPAEVPLTGGRITPGVVRVADTVRRPATGSSAFVTRLLTHLQRCQFSGAPRYLGRDTAGRDVLSYLPGWVPATFRRWSDTQVAAAGVLLRSLHDATRSSGLTGEHPVVCHHDPGPNNTVFRAGLPVAFIDFDTAAPGDPLEDIGYMAWTWCVSSKSTAPPAAEQAAQVRVLVDAYGLDAERRAAVVDAILDRQSRNIRWWTGRLTGPAHGSADPEESIAWSEREHAFTGANRPHFTAALR
ncbi:aminoglycoside phosphotransferase family protein [Nonomuraea deserti]|uniref:Aminoglycoside phosphotransferase family protein n=1 Tax=Nonomuraea deserti TaxID=1848322 RepID=A0A4R4VB16_9ACTN|nr:aminoglycoside phosphotransferase family protein [Nonomuraea deserti]TDD02312.1 aminoglycoside phosphotransferase family protein [Nonomuraea deserti]